MFQSLLTALTPLLKGLIMLDNARLTLQPSGFLSRTATAAAAASVFSLHTDRRGSESAQCGIVMSSCGSSQDSVSQEGGS